MSDCLSFPLFTTFSVPPLRIPDPKERLNALRRVCDRLSHENLVNLRYLVKFLDLLSRYSEVNKMSSQNIAMAITPSLMWAPAGENGENTMAMDMSATNVHSVVVYNLISHANFFFPEGEFKFNPYFPTSDFYFSVCRRDIYNGCHFRCK